MCDIVYLISILLCYPLKLFMFMRCIYKLNSEVTLCLYFYFLLQFLMMVNQDAQKFVEILLMGFFSWTLFFEWHSYQCRRIFLMPFLFNCNLYSVVAPWWFPITCCFMLVCSVCYLLPLLVSNMISCTDIFKAYKSVWRIWSTRLPTSASWCRFSVGATFSESWLWIPT
jgi:hypothetical protein